MCCLTCLSSHHWLHPRVSGKTLRAATIYCRIKTGNSKQRMVNAGSDATLEKRIPVFQVLFSHYLPWLKEVRVTKCSWIQGAPFSSRTLAALAAIFLHGKPCFHRSKTQSWPVWGRVANTDCNLETQLNQDQFCHPLCINYSCLYHIPSAPHFGVWQKPLSMRTATSSQDKEITKSYVAPWLRAVSQELPSLFLTLGPSMNYTSSIISLHLNILTLQ